MVPAASAPTNRLYRNRADGTFEDVTATRRARGAPAGPPASAPATTTTTAGSICSSPTSASNVLYRNRGGGRFEDVTQGRGARAARRCDGAPAARSSTSIATAGSICSSRTTCASILRPAPEPGQGANCVWKGMPVNCGPKGLPTDTNLLYRNAATARSRTCPSASGIAQVTGRYPMTAVAADLDGDGWTDIYVASRFDGRDPLSQQPATARSRTSRVESGDRVQRTRQRAGRAWAWRPATINNDGLLDLLKTHFADDIPSLYRNLGKGLFEDVATAAGLGVQNRYVEWGAGLPDFDNDGLADLLYVTGNVYPEIERSCRSTRTAGRASCSGTRDGTAVRGCDRAQRRRRHRPRTRAAAPRSATSTTTATSTCS